MNPAKNIDVSEVIFIGLPGTTHHYGGLSGDNIASSLNRGSESSPKQAALQAIALARYLTSLGITVALLPPQLRPDMQALQHAGFDMANAPLNILEQVSSSSFMWAANAATVTPPWDSKDDKLHLTVANLHTNPHRRIEARATYKIMGQIFANVPGVKVHEPLDASKGFLDEGAANHMLLASSHREKGLHVFVYGKRQNLEASMAIVHSHNIPKEQVLFLEQNPEVIKKGVFHNDVIAVSNENLLLVHERAYVNGKADIASIKASYHVFNPGKKLQVITITDKDLSVEEAVHSYFFNSQIVTGQDGKMEVIAPLELKTLYDGKAAALMDRICEASDNAINGIHYLDLRQSMRNGGGPACLRLRVPLNADSLRTLKADTGLVASEAMLSELEKLVEKYYTEKLLPEGLRSTEIYNNSREFLENLSVLFKINI